MTVDFKSTPLEPLALKARVVQFATPFVGRMGSTTAPSFRATVYPPNRVPPGLQGEPPKATLVMLAGGVFRVLKACVGQRGLEGCRATSSAAIALGPHLPRSVKNIPGGAPVWAAFAAFIQPLAKSILGLEVVAGGSAHALRGTQTVRLPFETPLNHPPQDPGPFRSQFLGELQVDDSGLPRERHHLEAPLHCVVDPAQIWLVVAAEQQLECRLILEIVLPHVSCRDLLAAAQCLDPELVPPSSSLCLLGAYETCAAQPCKLGRVSVVLGLSERLHTGIRCIIPQDAAYHVDEGAFAVASAAITKKYGLLSGVAAKTVASHPLKERDL